MQVILLENIKKLGNIGDQIKVRNGFGRNYLLAQNKALRASEQNIKLYEQKKEEFAKTNNEKKLAAKAGLQKIKNKTFILIRQASDEGILYGSVNPRDIQLLLKEYGIESAVSNIKFPHKVKNIGVHHVTLNLYAEIEQEIKVYVSRSNEEALALIQKENNASKEKRHDKEKNNSESIKG